MRLTTLSFVSLLAIVLGMGSVFAQVNNVRWLNTHQWSGQGVMETEIFSFYGDKSRIAFSPKGPAAFEIIFVDMQNNTQQYIIRQATGFAMNGRINLKSNTKAGYLIIRGAGNSWQVTVEQRLDTVDEWNFLQDNKKPLKMAKLGTWSGASGQSEISLTVPEGHWRLRFEQFSPGALTVKVVNQYGIVAMAAETAVSGEQHAWIHGAGTFTIVVSSSLAEWVVNAERQLFE